MKKIIKIVSIKFYTLYFLIILFPFSGCGQNIKIKQEEVKSVLEKYGTLNPENKVLIKTEFGDIQIKLYQNTPLHRANFIRLIKNGYYDKAQFYRVIRNFMIQGGNTSYSAQNWTIPAEILPENIHKRGALAAARVEEDNPGMNSDPTEFYLVMGKKYNTDDLISEAKELSIALQENQMAAYTTQGGYLPLDGKYTVFGEVTQGLDVIEKIANQPTRSNNDKPIEKIRFSVSILP